MKNGKKPTLAQKKFLQGKGLVPENWLIVKDTPVELVAVSRAALLKKQGRQELSGRSDYEGHGKKAMPMPEDLEREWNEVRVCFRLLQCRRARIVTKRMLDGSVKRYTEVRKAGE